MLKDFSKKSGNFGGQGRVVFSAVAIFVISQFVAAFLVISIVSIFHGSAGAATILSDSTLAQFFYVLVAEALTAGLVFAIIKRRALGLADVGLGRRPKLADLGNAATAFLGFYALLIVATLLIAWLFPGLDTDQPQNLGFDKLQSTTDSILAFIALVVLPPLGEELLVRGYLYSGLRVAMKFIPALLLTSLIFGAAHLGAGGSSPLVWAAAIETFILSVALVYLREKTGALYAGILLHFTNNLIAFGVHFQA